MSFWAAATLAALAGLLAGEWMLGLVPHWGALLIWPALGYALWRLPALPALQRSGVTALFMLGFCGVGTYWLPASASGLRLPESLLYAFWIGQTLVAALPWALAGGWVRSQAGVWTFPLWAIGLSVVLPTALPVFPAVVLGDLPLLTSAVAGLGPAGASVLALWSGVCLTAPKAQIRWLGAGVVGVWLCSGYIWLNTPKAGVPVEAVLIRPASASFASPPAQVRSQALQQQAIAVSAEFPGALVLWPELNWVFPQPGEDASTDAVWRTHLAGPVSGDMGPFRQDGQLIPTQGWLSAEGAVGDRRSKIGVVPMIEDGWRNASDFAWLPHSWQQALSARHVSAGRSDDPYAVWSIWPEVVALPFMCFEGVRTTVLPWPARHANRPAVALVSASDAWTPHALASNAHHAARRLLAVSLGRPVLVATLAGPLLHIDAHGNVVATEAAGAHAAQLKVRPYASTASVYAHWAAFDLHIFLLLMLMMSVFHVWQPYIRHTKK
ncbi:MAG: hypothetical protein RLZZ612_1811 [Pseudomonadota bacterium]